MKPVTKKTNARKAMRVATVFTGAAGAAALFAPTAMAGTGHTARADGKTVTHRLMGQIGKAHPMNSFGRVSGNIQLNSNCSTTPHWVHIKGHSTLGASNTERCFGFKGTYDVSSGLLNGAWIIEYECGGTNFGYLNPRQGDHQGFGPGTGFRRENNYHMGSIKITGWSAGGKACPVSP